MQKLAKYRSLIEEAAGDPSGICVLRRRCWIPCEINSKVRRRNSNGFPFFLRLLRECATFSLFLSLPLPSGHQDYDQLAKDFTRVFLNIEPSCLQNAHLFDVVFLVGQSKQKARFIGVRAILGVRSRVFQVNNLALTCFSKTKIIHE